MPNTGDIVDPNEWLFRRYYAKEPRKLLASDGGVHSRVFKPRQSDNGNLSVDAKSLTTYEKAIKNEVDYVLFEIANKSVLTIGSLKTIHDPIKDNQAHCLIQKIEQDDDLTPSLLARHARRALKGNSTES